MLSGCASTGAGSTSRTLQPKEEQVDALGLKKEYITLQKAVEIVKKVLKENKYSVTHFKCKPNRYAYISGKKSVPDPERWLFPDTHKYRAEIKITKNDQGHQYEVSAYRKIEELDWDFSPFSGIGSKIKDLFKRSPRDKKEEQKILDGIESAIARWIVFGKE